MRRIRYNRLNATARSLIVQSFAIGGRIITHAFTTAELDDYMLSNELGVFCMGISRPLEMAIFVGTTSIENTIGLRLLHELGFCFNKMINRDVIITGYDGSEDRYVSLSDGILDTLRTACLCIANNPDNRVTFNGAILIDELKACIALE